MTLWKPAQYGRNRTECLGATMLGHKDCTDQEPLAFEVKAWKEERNGSVVKVHWRFTTADARIKLAHLYTRIEV